MLDGLVYSSYMCTYCNPYVTVGPIYNRDMWRLWPKVLERYLLKQLHKQFQRARLERRSDIWVGS